MLTDSWQYTNRRPRALKPTAHLSYDEGINLIRRFLRYASTQTVEDLQRFTAQKVPVPHWVKVIEDVIPEEQLKKAAEILQKQLGHHGIEKVGGKTWWQWRIPDKPLKAEWIEMKSDIAARKKIGDMGRRVMFYIHGGAYFFGSVDVHRYQLQRHARKLNARLYAPRYRLAPQFPFPCGLQDCLAAYLQLLASGQEPSTIVMAGDSAGGGMVLSMLCTLRDQGLPLPAGAVLLSPWVDLTHSFPSVAEDSPFDYVPGNGFHQRPSAAWPPPNADDMLKIEQELVKELAHKQHLPKENVEDAVRGFRVSESVSVEEHETGPHTTHPGTGPANPYPRPGHNISIQIDGKVVELIDQIHMYASNQLLGHPLVSPVLQPSLGGLPPLLILVGGGEMLRDEQIYLAHKAANPEKHPPNDIFLDEHPTDELRKQVTAWKPTDVQLQVWDDLCHVAPTLSFTRPAKYMYRSVAQFSAWALARAQHTGIEIMDDDAVSVISDSVSDDEYGPEGTKVPKTAADGSHGAAKCIGKAGDPLPSFKKHMIRQRVDRHGNIFPLAPTSELPACQMTPDQVGCIKEGPVRKWIERKLQMDTKYASQKRKVQKQRLKEMRRGYMTFGNEEVPPPSALAGRRLKDVKVMEEKKAKSWALGLWSIWGSKHDEKTIKNEEKAQDDETETVASKVVSEDEGAHARPLDDTIAKPDAIPETAKHGDTLQVPGVATGGSRPGSSGDERSLSKRSTFHSRSRSNRRVVMDENQTAGTAGDSPDINEDTPAAFLMAAKAANGEPVFNVDPTPSFASPDATNNSTTDGAADGSAGKLADPKLQDSVARPSTDHLEIPDAITKTRPKSNWIAFPFSLKRRQERPQSQASLMTLGSEMSVRPVGDVRVPETMSAGGK